MQQIVRVKQREQKETGLSIIGEHDRRTFLKERKVRQNH